MQAPQLRAIAVVVRLAFEVNAGLATLLAVLTAANAMLPVASAAVTGAIVGRAAGRSTDGLAGLLIVFAVLQVVPVTEARWRISDVLGNRVGDLLDRRVTMSVLGPAGVAHLEDPDVQDSTARAATFWNSSILEGILNVIVCRVGGAGAAVLLGASAGWRYTFLLAGAWIVAGRWSWRRASQSVDVQFGKMAELRHAEYAGGIALGPAAAKEVRVFGLTDWVATRYVRLWSSAMASLWRDRRRGVAPSMAIALVVAVVHGFVFVALARAALSGTLSTAALAVAVQAVLGVADLASIPFGHWEFEYGLRTVPANKRLVELVSEPRFSLPGSSPSDGLPAREIRMDAVSFAYPGSDRRVLDDIDLVIEAGTSLAIVGANGAGKTTLVKLICRFYDPTAGRILVDGVELATLDPHGWHTRIAGLFQEFVRYPLSARDNVALGGGAGEAIVREAARRAGVADVIDGLPAGWDTLLTRRFVGGTELSGGEWQRVALARALVAVAQGAGLLVLDEPTAHLDARAEAEFYDRFLELTGGVTTVLISHRFSTVRRAEHVAVLDAGRIAEYGTHDELLAAGGRYAQMFRLQADRFAGA